MPVVGPPTTCIGPPMRLVFVWHKASVRFAGTWRRYAFFQGLVWDNQRNRTERRIVRDRTGWHRPNGTDSEKQVWEGQETNSTGEDSHN